MEDNSDELLMLARKVWPYEHSMKIQEVDGEEVDGGCLYVDDGGGYELAFVRDHPKAREAIHALLLVLAGKLSIKRDDDGRLAVSCAGKGYMVELDLKEPGT